MAEAKTAKQLSQIDVSSKKVWFELSDANIVVVANSFLAKTSAPTLDRKHIELPVITFLQQ